MAPFSSNQWSPFRLTKTTPVLRMGPAGWMVTRASMCWIRVLHSKIRSVRSMTGVYDYTKRMARRISNVCRSPLLLGASEPKRILDDLDLKGVLLDLTGWNN